MLLPIVGQYGHRDFIVVIEGPELVDRSPAIMQ
jgi:hypothetical protein